MLVHMPSIDVERVAHFGLLGSLTLTNVTQAETDLIDGTFSLSAPALTSVKVQPRCFESRYGRSNRRQPL